MRSDGWWLAENSESISPEDAYSAALGAIGSVVSLSSWVLGILAFIMAAIAIFGWTYIYNASKAAARKVSKNCTETYLSSEEFAVLLKRQVNAALDDRLLSETVSSNNDTDDADPFPDADAFSLEKHDEEGRA